MKETRKTGLEVVGEMPWGTHFCLFYETTQDLLDTLTQYCKAGVEGGEYCLWIVADPLTREQAIAALRETVPAIDRYLSENSIEIVPASNWYLDGGSFDIRRVTNRWLEKLELAMSRGYSGVRVTGDTTWLQKKDQHVFSEYESGLNDAIAGQRLAVLCTYPLGACGAAEILDVVRTHQFAVARRHGGWDVIETAGLKQAKASIKRLNEELEQRVLDRTRELEQSTGRLIHAQENERSRIARELHDHISQMLGLLSIKLDRLTLHSAAAPTIANELADVRRGVTEVIDEVRHVSRRLHSSTLEYLGLAPALERLVAEFSTRHGIAIRLAQGPLPSPLPPAVALTLFRIAEESLSNIARHSQARSAHVAIESVADGIHLTVQDDGVGFDVAHAAARRGLGFVSMQERLRVLQGTVRVDSSPGSGTTVDVWIPATDFGALNVQPAYPSISSS